MKKLFNFTCTKCKITYEGAQKVKSICFKCYQREYHKKDRETNKEKYRERGWKYREKNREHLKNYHARWRRQVGEENFTCPKCKIYYEKIRVVKSICLICHQCEYQKKEYEKNPERYKEYRRKAYEKNPERFKSYQKKYIEKNIFYIQELARWRYRQNSIKLANKRWSESTS